MVWPLREGIWIKVSRTPQTKRSAITMSLHKVLLFSNAGTAAVKTQIYPSQSESSIPIRLSFILLCAIIYRCLSLSRESSKVWRNERTEFILCLSYKGTVSLSTLDGLKLLIGRQYSDLFYSSCKDRKTFFLGALTDPLLSVFELISGRT